MPAARTTATHTAPPAQDAPRATAETLFGVEHLPVFEGAEWIAFDSETTGLRPEVGGLRLVQLAAPGLPVVVVDVWEGGLDALQALFEVERHWYAHNAVFDLSWLQEHGIVPAGEVFCTMLASRLLNNGIPNVRNGLAPVVERYLGRELSKEQQKSDWSAPNLSTEQLTYAAEDVRTLVDLVPVLTERLHVARLLRAFSLECKAMPAIAQMQRTGIPFNRTKLTQLNEFYVSEVDRLGEEFVRQLDDAMPEDEKLPRDADGTYNLRAKAEGSVRAGTKRLAGFNLNSPKQLVHKLGVLLGGVPVDKTGKPSASRQALRAYAADHQVIQTYLAWKRAEKRRQMTVSLIEHQDVDGAIRANYLQLGADTGRFSCREPNLQQVPRDKGFREAAEAPKGWCFVCADFGQMELRLAAAVSGDTLMTRAFQNNEDLHTLTAQAVYGVADWEAADNARRKYMRQVAKACFSGDTEVLTPTGWVRLDAYTGGPVAQYCVPGGVQLNPVTKKPGPGYVSGRVAPWDGNNGVLEFVEPVDYRSFMSSDVWHCEDRNTAITATGNHDIFYVDAYGVARKRQLADVTSPRSFIAAGYLKRDVYALAAVQTRVLAMVVADGSFKQSKGYVSLGFSKRRKIRRCVELLDTAGITYSRSVYKNGDNEPTTFFKFRESEAAWLRCYVSPDKVLSLPDCLRLDALVYLEEAQYWDGTVHEGESRDRVFVSTVVKESADVMQAMAVTSGIPCTITTEYSDRYSTGACYTVSYAFGTTPVWRPSWNPVKAPEQMVRCVQVASGLLLVRKHNKVCVQGNCNFGLLYGSGAQGLREYAGSMGITMTVEEATQIRDTFHATYPGISKWQQEAARTASLSHGDKWAEVRIPNSELRRFLPGDLNRLTTRCNTPIQGAGAAVLKLALGRLWPLVRASAESTVKLSAVVHDEVLMLCREEVADEWCARLSEVMEGAEALWLGDIPPLAESAKGATWQDAK